MEPKTKKKYVSCNLIEHGFDTLIDSINFCCRSSNSGGGFKSLISNYHGEKIDWDEFFKIKNYYREQMRQGNIIEECKGCIYLEEKEWDDEDYISYMNFNHGMVCNCKCIYCYLDDIKGTQVPYSILPVIKDMIDKNILRTGGHITIAGGEPTADPDFEEMLDIFVNFGLNPIRVLTNGIKYSESIAKGIQKGCLTTVISIDSGTKKTYEKIKRVNCFDKVWENIKKYAQNKMYPFSVKAKYIIIPGINDNKKEIDKFLDKAKNANLEEVCVDIEQFWYNENSSNLPLKTVDLLKYFIDKANKYNLKPEPIDRAILTLKQHP